MFKTSLLFTLLFFSSLCITAQQSIDLVTLSQNFSAPANYTNPQGDKISEATELNTLVNVKLPIPINEKLIWYNDITYSINELQIKATDTFDRTVYRLNGLVIQTGLVFKLNDNTSLQTILTPRFMGERLQLNQACFQLGGIVLLERKYSDKLTLRYGVLYNNDRFGPFFVPLLYTNWQPFGNWFVNGLWPIYGKIGNQITERLQVGISEFGLVTSYILNETNPSSYMERSSVDLALFSRFKLYKNWHLEGRIGYSLSRGYEQYSNTEKLNFKLSIVDFYDKLRTLENGTLSSAPFINFRLVYNFPLPQ